MHHGIEASAELGAQPLAISAGRGGRHAKDAGVVGVLQYTRPGACRAMVRLVHYDQGGPELIQPTEPPCQSLHRCNGNIRRPVDVRPAELLNVSAADGGDLVGRGDYLVEYSQRSEGQGRLTDQFLPVFEDQDGIALLPGLTADVNERVGLAPCLLYTSDAADE